MILSASGWRKIFTEDKDGESTSKEIGNDNKILSYLIGTTFAEYIKSVTGKASPEVVIATDTRPTGAEIARVVLNASTCSDIKCVYLGYASAPEIMAYAKNFDGFIYISASHNPVGHNGIKFGLSDGGVLEGGEAKKLIESFKKKCSEITQEEQNALLKKLEGIPAVGAAKYYKKQSLKSYEKFIRHVISGCEKPAAQKVIFNEIKKACKKNPLTLVCDMNGSARGASIDKKFIPSCRIKLEAFNDIPGQIVHAIIPEPENLVHCADKMQQMQKDGITSALLGYMPDCDGDRGNIVYWNEKTKTAQPIPAQEVFALCVMAELSFEYWKNPSAKNLAVAVNCPTSMRIDEIASSLGAKVFRAEVGEANVVNLAREKRAEGFNVRIFGEGSNGGNITYPSAVRDPVATIFALVKLLSLRDTKNGEGLFHIWCKKSGQEDKYRNDFTLADVISTLPSYTTTGVSEERAVLQVKMEDKGKLKENFKTEFKKFFEEKKAVLESDYGITSWDCCLTNGTKETVGAENWNNANGGLKVRFNDKNRNPVAFIWMRPSGTEPVFRVMCDVKGNNPEGEKQLLAWETEILQKADK